MLNPKKTRNQNDALDAELEKYAEKILFEIPTAMPLAFSENNFNFEKFETDLSYIKSAFVAVYGNMLMTRENIKTFKDLLKNLITNHNAILLLQH